jgi:hypothetical protein
MTTAQVEWGLHFVDGLSFFGIVAVTVVGVMGAVVTGVTYSLKTKDRGAAAGWAALPLGAVAIFVAVVTFYARPKK